MRSSRRAFVPPAANRDPQEHFRQLRDYVTSVGENDLRGWVQTHVGAAQIVAPPAAFNAPQFANTPPGWRMDGVAIDEELFVGFELPDQWAPFIDERVYVDVHWCKSTNAAGNVRWSLEAFYETPNAVIPAATTIAAFAPLASTSDTNTANKHLITRIGPFIPGSDAKLLSVHITRTQSHASDTYGADAILLSAALQHFILGITRAQYQ